MKLHPCPAQNTVFQASHYSALLIGCVKFCSRLYIGALQIKSISLQNRSKIAFSLCIFSLKEDFSRPVSAFLFVQSIGLRIDYLFVGLNNEGQNVITRNSGHAYIRIQQHILYLQKWPVSARAHKYGIFSD